MISQQVRLLMNWIALIAKLIMIATATIIYSGVFEAGLLKCVKFSFTKMQQIPAIGITMAPMRELMRINLSSVDFQARNPKITVKTNNATQKITENALLKLIPRSAADVQALANPSKMPTTAIALAVGIQSTCIAVV